MVIPLLFVILLNGFTMATLIIPYHSNKYFEEIQWKQAVDNDWNCDAPDLNTPQQRKCSEWKTLAVAMEMWMAYEEKKNVIDLDTQLSMLAAKPKCSERQILRTKQNERKMSDEEVLGTILQLYHHYLHRPTKTMDQNNQLPNDEQREDPKPKLRRRIVTVQQKLMEQHAKTGKTSRRNKRSPDVHRDSEDKTLRIKGKKKKNAKQNSTSLADEKQTRKLKTKVDKATSSKQKQKEVSPQSLEAHLSRDYATSLEQAQEYRRLWDGDYQTENNNIYNEHGSGSDNHSPNNMSDQRQLREYVPQMFPNQESNQNLHSSHQPQMDKEYKSPKPLFDYLSQPFSKALEQAQEYERRQKHEEPASENYWWNWKDAEPHESPKNNVSGSEMMSSNDDNLPSEHDSNIKILSPVFKPNNDHNGQTDELHHQKSQQYIIDADQELSSEIKPQEKSSAKESQLHKIDEPVNWSLLVNHLSEEYESEPNKMSPLRSIGTKSSKDKMKSDDERSHTMNEMKSRGYKEKLAKKAEIISSENKQNGIHKRVIEVKQSDKIPKESRTKSNSNSNYDGKSEQLSRDKQEMPKSIMSQDGIQNMDNKSIKIGTSLNEMPPSEFKTSNLLSAQKLSADNKNIIDKLSPSKITPDFKLATPNLKSGLRENISLDYNPFAFDFLSSQQQGYRSESLPSRRLSSVQRLQKLKIAQIDNQTPVYNPPENPSPRGKLTRDQRSQDDYKGSMHNDMSRDSISSDAFPMSPIHNLVRDYHSEADISKGRRYSLTQNMAKNKTPSNLNGKGKLVMNDNLVQSPILGQTRGYNSEMDRVSASKRHSMKQKLPKFDEKSPMEIDELVHNISLEDHTSNGRLSLGNHFSMEPKSYMDEELVTDQKLALKRNYSVPDHEFRNNGKKIFWWNNRAQCQLVKNLVDKYKETVGKLDEAKKNLENSQLSRTSSELSDSRSMITTSQELAVRTSRKMSIFWFLGNKSPKSETPKQSLKRLEKELKFLKSKLAKIKKYLEEDPYMEQYSAIKLFSDESSKMTVKSVTSCFKGGD